MEAIFSKRLVYFIISGLAIGILFYDSLVIGIIVVIFLLIYYKRQKKTGKLKDVREKELTIQWKDALQSISAYLEAGYSVENAWREAKKELLLLYPVNAEITKEFTIMECQLNNHIPMEKILQEFANRRKIESIKSFVTVFLTAKRSGGDMIKVTRTASEMIRIQLETAQEIETILSGKKYEAEFMKLVPSILILYFRICSPGYLDIFYHSLLGILCMTIVLGINLAAAVWARRIAAIEL